MQIPFLDLGRLHRSIAADIDVAIERVVGSSAFIGGAEVAGFEAAFATAQERAFAVGCASGTDALSLALRACGIGPGDEVVVPAMTFFATAEAVTHVGAVPVIADVDPDTLLLGVEHVDAVTTPRTRGVIPVHLYGHVVPFDDIEAWRDAGLVVVEDAAQAHLARWKDRPIGSESSVTCFSFFPGKNLGAFGDAGAIVTDRDDVAAAVRKTRDHGRVEKYVHDELGVSSRLDGLQAAILAAKLPHLQGWTDARRRLADEYAVALAEVAGATVVPWDEGAVHHLLVVRVDPDRRDAIQAGLAERGVATGVHYPVPLTQQPPFAAARPCPASERAATEVLSLPMDPLMTSAEVEHVVAALAAVV